MEYSESKKSKKIAEQFIQKYENCNFDELDEEIKSKLNNLKKHQNTLPSISSPSAYKKKLQK